MADKKAKQRGLGRGLSALMADVNESHSENPGLSPRPDGMIPIEKISPNPEQPRRAFDEAGLEDLAASIREKGIIQPLIVRPASTAEDHFEIVAGERRWRAAQMAKLHEVPALVRDFDDTEVLEVAIIENVQRADLNAVEEAVGYHQLMEKFGHTQEKLATALGKSRSHIANSVRLLSLPDEIQGYLRDERLFAGHARALITAEDPVALSRQVVKKGLSVRETEKLVKAGQEDEKRKSPSSKTKPGKDADTKALEGDLSAHLGMNVSVDHKPGQENGRMTISYESLEQLDDLCRLLSVSNSDASR